MLRRGGLRSPSTAFDSGIEGSPEDKYDKCHICGAGGRPEVSEASGRRRFSYPAPSLLGKLILLE